MQLTFVTPAWRRTAVTRISLAQRRVLCDELSLRGITADCIIVADDENVEVAEEFGFQALLRPNLLGYKLNSGIELALEQGADYVSFVGSDDWMHPDMFDRRMMDGRTVVSGRKICLYDLATGHSKIVSTRSPYGVIPWLIPRKLLRPKMVPDHQETGLDIHLGLALGNCEWWFHDPHPLTRVDFKSSVGLTPYGTKIGPVAPKLETRYPLELIDMVYEYAMAEAA